MNFQNSKIMDVKQEHETSKAAPHKTSDAGETWIENVIRRGSSFAITEFYGSTRRIESFFLFF